MANPIALRNLRVLVADPVSQMADLTTSSLKAIGVGAVVKAGSSEEVLTALSRFDFSAIFIDLMLKPLGPIEISAIIRDSGRNAGVPMIAIGNAVYRATVEAAMKAGITKVIGRPASADILRWALFSVLHSEPTELDQHFL